MDLVFTTFEVITVGLAVAIVSLVAASEHPFVENNVYKNIKQDKALDEKLEKMTYAMVAVPLYFLNEVRGVISCVAFTATPETGHALFRIEGRHVRHRCGVPEAPTREVRQP